MIPGPSMAYTYINSDPQTQQEKIGLVSCVHKIDVLEFELTKFHLHNFCIKQTLLMKHLIC